MKLERFRKKANFTHKKQTEEEERRQNKIKVVGGEKKKQRWLREHRKKVKQRQKERDVGKNNTVLILDKFWSEGCFASFHFYQIDLLVFPPFMLVSFHPSSLPHDEQTVTEMRHKQAVFCFFCLFVFSVNISVNILSLQETDENDFSTFAF